MHNDEFIPAAGKISTATNALSSILAWKMTDAIDMPAHLTTIRGKGGFDAT
jgi:hypothetical protein